MKHFIFAVLFALVFVCSTEANSQSPKNTKVTNKKKVTSANKKQQAPQIVEEKIIEKVVFTNPNQKIAYYNHLGKVAYNIPRDTIADYFLQFANADKKVYAVKNISIQKATNNDIYELVIIGINTFSNNGFAVSFPAESYENNFYLKQSSELTIRGGVGSGCQKIKLSDNNCNCDDGDWLGEGTKGGVNYFSFNPSHTKFEVKALNFIFDYTKFCDYINNNVIKSTSKSNGT